MPKKKTISTWHCVQCNGPVDPGKGLCEACISRINDPTFQDLRSHYEGNGPLSRAKDSPVLGRLRSVARRFFRHPTFTVDTIHAINDWLLEQGVDDHNKRLAMCASEIAKRLSAAEAAFSKGDSKDDPNLEASATIANRTTPQWDRATEARNKYVYNQCVKGTVYKRIIAGVQRHTTWEPLNTIPSIKRVAAAYAKRHKKPTPPPRQHGRSAKV